MPRTYAAAYRGHAPYPCLFLKNFEESIKGMKTMEG